MNREYEIDPEFLRLTVPNTKEQQAMLESSLLREGCLEPIFVWNNFIVDGHKRYTFCIFEEMDFVVEKLNFNSREEVVSWVCKRRLYSLLKSSVIYKYLSGKYYRCIRPRYKELAKAGELEVPTDTRGRIRISKTMSKDLGVSYSAIENLESYSRYMDKIADWDYEIFTAIISEQLNATIKEVRLIAKGDYKTRRMVRGRFHYDEKSVRSKRRAQKEKTDEYDGIMLSTGIKNMPAFDPDMEINGLSLTIPSWMASIARAEQKTDMNLATEYSKKKLANNLMRLDEQIQKTLEAIECTKMEF